MHSRTRPNALIAGLVLLFVGLSAMAQRTATAIPTVVNGFIVAIIVTDGGSGYSTPPSVTITGGGGTAASATATVLNGAVDKVIVSNAGSGYTGSPSITIAAPPSPTPPFSEGLVAYYPFNGNANDESGNGNMGTAFGPQPATDRFGRADSTYQFDGTDDYIYVSNSPSLNFGEQITVSAWVFLDSLRPTPAEGGLPVFIVTKSVDTGLAWTDQTDWAFAINGDKQRFHLNIGDTWNYWDATEGVKPRVWQHVVFTYDRSTMRTYLNAVQTGQKAADGDFQIDPAPLWIGAYYASYPRAFLPGRIDDVRIYNRALSDQEVKDLYRYEAPEQPWVSIAVQTVELTMHVKPTKKYQLDSSFDLKTWSKVGEPIFAASSEIPVTVNVLHTGQFFRVYEVQ